MATGLNRYLLIIFLFWPNDLVDMIFLVFVLLRKETTRSYAGRCQAG